MWTLNLAVILDLVILSGEEKALMTVGGGGLYLVLKTALPAGARNYVCGMRKICTPNKDNPHWNLTLHTIKKKRRSELRDWQSFVILQGHLRRSVTKAKVHETWTYFKTNLTHLCLFLQNVACPFNHKTMSGTGVGWESKCIRRDWSRGSVRPLTCPYGAQFVHRDVVMLEQV